MAGHLLGVLEPSVVFQVNSDAGCSPGVTSNRREKIAAHALYRLRARPVAAIPAELTLWNRGWGFFAYPRKKVQSRITPQKRSRFRSGFQPIPERFRPRPQALVYRIRSVRID